MLVGIGKREDTTSSKHQSKYDNQPQTVQVSQSSHLPRRNQQIAQATDNVLQVGHRHSGVDGAKQHTETPRTSTFSSSRKQSPLSIYLPTVVNNYMILIVRIAKTEDTTSSKHQSKYANKPQTVQVSQSSTDLQPTDRPINTSHSAHGPHTLSR